MENKNQIKGVIKIMFVVFPLLFILFTTTNIAVKKERVESSCMGDALQPGENPAEWYGLYHLNEFIYPLTPITNDGYSTLVAGCGTYHNLHKVGLYHLWINIPYWFTISMLLSYLSITISKKFAIKNGFPY